MAATKTTNKKAVPVKMCYSHVGGRLGNLLAETFVTKGWIKQAEGNERLYHVTTKGKKAFKDMGVDLSLIPEENIEQ